MANSISISDFSFEFLGRGATTIVENKAVKKIETRSSVTYTVYRHEYIEFMGIKLPCAEPKRLRCITCKKPHKARKSSYADITDQEWQNR